MSVKPMISQSASATTNTAAKPITRGTRQEREAEIDALEGVRHVDGAGVGAEGIEQRVLDDDGEPERHQQHVAVVAMRGRPDDEALQAVAEREEGRRQEEGGKVGIDARA